jgi:hypothetical protein
MKKAVALILMIFLILICSLAALVAFSLLTRGTESSLGFSQSIQAHAIAIAGKEWYFEQLENDSDWSDEVNQADIALGPGGFDIAINSASNNRVSFTVTGKIQGPSNQIVQRQISLEVRKYLKPFLFALFWGRDTGSFLQLIDSTIDGNLWSRGTTNVERRSSVSDVAYCPNNEDIIGSGIYRKQKINPPYPDMPEIDDAYYKDLIRTFNKYIKKYKDDYYLTTDLVLNGDIIECKNFFTNGNISISGNGYIVATEDINLHSTIQANGNLTISPSGGSIYFLAGETLYVNSTRNDTNVIINSGPIADNRVYLYARQRKTKIPLTIQKHRTTTTDINSAFIIGKGISVLDGSQLKGCILYMHENELQISDSNTSVSGAILALSNAEPGLIIDNGAEAAGFVYYLGEGSRGSAYLDNATIRGSVVSSQFLNNQINNCTVIYDPASLPYSLPIGSIEEVVVEPESWNDN